MSGFKITFKVVNWRTHFVNLLEPEPEPFMFNYRDIFTKRTVWTIDEALPFLAKLWKHMEPAYYLGLSGSVLYKGESFKDLDVLIYPNSKNVMVESVVAARLEKFGLKPKPSERRRIFAEYEGWITDTRSILVYEYQGKRIDFILVKGYLVDDPRNVIEK